MVAVYEEAMSTKHGIKTSDSAFFMGYKVRRTKEGDIIICSISEYSKIRPVGESELEVLSELGWVEGVKQLYLDKYTRLHNNSESEVVIKSAKSKLNKYYERFPKVK